jgi:hypothetical protein
MDIHALEKIEKDFTTLFLSLTDTQNKIRQMLEEHSDGKVLKGDELVGWLGEIYTKILFSGKLVDDSFEHDVETPEGWKISVKTRRGRNSGWTRSSAIPKHEGDDCPSHLMFVHLNENYSVQEMWLYPWDDLSKAGRFKVHTVRGQFRAFYMSVKPAQDDKYKIFEKGT